jgi:hypothetical protein
VLAALALAIERVGEELGRIAQLLGALAQLVSRPIIGLGEIAAIPLDLAP